jgi:TatD DNase family protein
VVAWGEIGLDYHYDHSPREVQREVFRRQLGIACDLDLPVVIHSRAADEETIEILREHVGAGVSPVNHAQDARTTPRAGVLHCFGGSLQMAEQAIELGFFISFAGNLTFKKADDLRAIARTLPLERLLVETDCPYLTPVPFRGKRNEPARVVETAKFLAELKGVEPDEVGKVTTAHFYGLFLS